MKLHERLGLRPNFWDPTHKIQNVEIARNVNPSADCYDRAWKNFDLPDSLHLLSLACFYSDEQALAKEHATQCIEEINEFFFGDWRNTFETREKTVDAGW